MNKNSMKREIWEVAIKSILFAVCAGVLTTLTHMLSDIFIFHSHGKPEFASTALIIYTSFDKVLMAIAYYIFGRKIPIKNAILRSLTFVVLNWVSNYLPQLMGLAFADGAIAQKAFSMSILACDTIVYLLLGIILGILFKEVPEKTLRVCNKKSYGKAIAISTVTFPALVIIVDQFMRLLYPSFSSSYVIQVSDYARVSFLINFYCWFLLTGAFIAVFYRLTGYNDYGCWWKFGLKYSLLLWTPVVMIMVMFGTAFLPTLVYAFLFFGIIMLISWINERMIGI